jgi:hypothetical protein
MLDALASLELLEERMGTIESEAAAQAALVDASALVRAEAGLDWEDEAPPDVVVVIVLAAAARGLRNPDGAQAEGIGTYNVTHGATSLGGVWLTANERRAIRRAIRGASSGIGSIELESPWQPEITTVPVDIGGDEMPWVTLGEDLT